MSDNSMDVSALIEEYDRVSDTLDDTALEQWLLDACARVDREDPENYRGRCAMYNELGGFYRAGGILDKGEKAFRKAQILLETGLREMNTTRCCCVDYSVASPFGENADFAWSRDYATTLNNLAGLYRLAGRFREAMNLFADARAIYDAHPETSADIAASCRNNLGLVYLDLREYDKALGLFAEAEAVLGDAADVDFARGTTNGNMAVALLGLGRRAEALERLDRAAALLRATAGEDSPIYQGCIGFAARLRGEGETT